MEIVRDYLEYETNQPISALNKAINKKCPVYKSEKTAKYLNSQLKIKNKIMKFRYNETEDAITYGYRSMDCIELISLVDSLEWLQRSKRQPAEYRRIMGK